MKFTTYAHAIIIAALGTILIQSNSIFGCLIGGVLIGTGLWAARRSGLEE